MSDTTLPLTRPSGRSGVIRWRTRGLRPHRRLQPLRPGLRPGLSPSWPPAASPIPASPIGSRPSGSPSCANFQPATRPCCSRSTWRPATAAPPPLRVPEGDRPGLRLRRLGDGEGLGGMMYVRPLADDAAARRRSTATPSSTASAPSRREPPTPADMDARRRAVQDQGLPTSWRRRTAASSVSPTLARSAPAPPIATPWRTASTSPRRARQGRRPAPCSPPSSPPARLWAYASSWRCIGDSGTPLDRPAPCAGLRRDRRGQECRIQARPLGRHRPHAEAAQRR